MTVKSYYNGWAAILPDCVNRRLTAQSDFVQSCRALSTTACMIDKLVCTRQRLGCIRQALDATKPVLVDASVILSLNNCLHPVLDQRQVAAGQSVAHVQVVAARVLLTAKTADRLH